MKLIRRFLEWLFSFFYENNPIEFIRRKQSLEEWNKLADPRQLYFRKGSSYLFRLRRNQLSKGYYDVNNFEGLKQ